ncbi:hypothetical protein EDD11_009666 [Mortierella claussenii]|nr:hypothetical protein EDD11_009666 [Mortierella claussenii]
MSPPSPPIPVARGIPLSPRRSHRGGQSKSRKAVEEDDGGQTRCVCNQQHHEGVMIQCETCKVWQHCPCVGLGDGEVTPDKYYCDECRPENHPYRIQDGQLMSNIKSASPTTPSINSGVAKAKASKKRSTMNSKDSAISTEFPTAFHSKDEGIDRASIVDKHSKREDNTVNGHYRASKRRKKNDSNKDQNDHTHQSTTIPRSTNGHTDESSPHGSGLTDSIAENNKDAGSPPSHNVDDQAHQLITKNTSIGNRDTPESPAAMTHCHVGNTDAMVLPASTSKRAGSRKGHMHAAESDTPTPSGTPQPMQPAPPAKIKYPTARMTLKDMNKRAQQLLEYIGRVHVEMTELKRRSRNKGGSTHSPICDSSSPTSTALQARSLGLTVDTAMQALKAESADKESRWLSTPPQSVHEMVHGDGSDAPATAPFKQKAEETMGMCYHPIDHPSSVPSGSALSKSQVPMTPPHQNGVGQDEAIPMELDESGNTHNNLHVKLTPAAATSLDLMDRLTSDLLRFQERFGKFGE